MAYLRQDGVYHFKNYASQHCYHFRENGEVCGFGLGQLKVEDIRNRLRENDYVCGKYTLEEDRINIHFEGGPRIHGRIENNRLLLQVRWDESNDNIESREYEFFVMPPETSAVSAGTESKTEPSRTTMELPVQSAITGILTEPIRSKAAESKDLPASAGKTKPLEPSGEASSEAQPASDDKKGDAPA